MKNIVFDFGNVLVRFRPDIMITPYVTDPEDVRAIAEVLFDRLYWDRLDAGTISDGEVISESQKRLPARLAEKVAEIYNNWFYHLPEIHGMREIVVKMKREYGAHIYLLSNISETFAAHAGEIPILSLTEGCVFSATCGLTKPDPRIFAHLCEKFGLDPAETVFVDDNAGNIEGARKAGLDAYHFREDPEELQAYLTEAFSNR